MLKIEGVAIGRTAAVTAGCHVAYMAQKSWRLGICRPPEYIRKIYPALDPIGD